MVESDRYRLQPGRLGISVRPDFGRNGRALITAQQVHGYMVTDHPTLSPYVHKALLSCSRQAASTPTSTSGKDRIVAIHLAQKPFPVEKRGIVVQQRAVDRHARFLCERLQQERVELDGRGDTVGVDVDERFRRDSRRLNGDGGDAARCGIR